MRRFKMVGLICLWNSCSMKCDTVAMFGVEVIVCWGFRVLVWLRSWCILWELCCGRCVVLVFVVLVDWLLLFSWCVIVGLYCWCTWEDLLAKVDVVMCVVFVGVLWVRWDSIWYCRWVVAWNVSVGDLCLDEWELADGACVCALQCLVGVWLAKKSSSVLWQQLGFGARGSVVFIVWLSALCGCVRSGLFESWLITLCGCGDCWLKYGLVKWAGVPLEWIWVCSSELLYFCFWFCFHFCFYFVSLNNLPLFW